MANLNLVVPVVAAVLVIIVAVIVICVLRGKGHGSDKGNYNGLFCFCLFSTQVRLLRRYVMMITRIPTSDVISHGYRVGSMLTL